MEPFSIATGVIGVLAAIDQAQKCIHKLKALKHAHSEILDVAEEVSQISGTLSEVSQLVTRGQTQGQRQEPSGARGQSNGHVQQQQQPVDLEFWQPQLVVSLDALGHRAAAKLHRITELVPHSSAREQEPALNRSNAGRDHDWRLRIKEEHWRWMRNRSQVRKLQAELHTLQLSLLTKLSLISSSAGLQLISGSTVNVKQSFAIDEYNCTLPDPDSGVDVEACKIVIDQTSDLVICESEHIHGSEAMTRRLPQVLSQATESKDQQVQKAKNKVTTLAQSRRTACKAFCSCQCHRKALLPFRSVVSQYCGSLFVCSNGVFFGFNNCTEKQCRRNACQSFQLIFKPPRWLSTRNFQFSFLSDPKYGPEINIRLPRCIDWDAPVWKLAVLGDTQGIQDMFDRNEASPYDVNPLGGSLLHYAVDRCYFDLCRLLLERGATPSIYDDNGIDPTKKAWELFLSGRLTEEQSMLVRDKFDDDCLQARQFTILHKIILGLSSANLASILELSTADIDAPDAEGRTCISWAAYKADAACIETLLEFSADPNIPDLYQRAPLHYVQSAKCCELLVKGGAHMDSFVLHIASSPPGNVEVVRSLVSLGANVHALDSYGDTPLVVATYNGHCDCALALLEGFKDEDEEDSLELMKVFGVAILFERYDIINHLHRYSKFGQNLSLPFLDALPGSETEAVLLKWFQKTRSNLSDFESEHETIMAYLIQKHDEFTTVTHPCTLNEKIIEVHDWDLDALRENDDEFVDASQYL